MANYRAIELDLLRHGECEGGAIFRGRSDSPLTDAGLAAMLEQARACHTEWDLVFSSPLQRCKHFAERWCRGRDLDVIYDERLLEIDFGDWEGRSIDAVMREQPEHFNAWSESPDQHPPPNGENLADLTRRVNAFLAELEGLLWDSKVLLVIHGGVFRAVMQSLLGLPRAHINRLHVPHACASRFIVYHYGGTRSVKLLTHNLGGRL